MDIQAIIDWEYLPQAMAGLVAGITVPIAVQMKTNWDR